MLKRVRKTIADSAMLEWGNHVLVAVSGGPDSVALLRVLVLLSFEYELRLTTAHLNHGLRGAEAQAEEAFVHNLCAGMGINCISKTVDIRALRKGSGKSLEEVGREQRYRFLDETAQTCGAKKIATGHHRDDQAETVLINFLRGSGLEGLKGIVPVREGRIIRPLLHIGRKEILEFLDHEELPYIVDSSNLSPHFLRNRIRHQLIPELAARYNPAIVRGLSQTAEIIRREDDYLQGVVRRILNGWGVVPGEEEMLLPLTDFIDLHEALQGRVIKYLLASAAPSGNSIGYRHVEAVLALARMSHRSKASLDLPGLIRVEKDRNFLKIHRVNARPVRSDNRKGMRSEI
ncbi:MAG: tRNA lysidine(34) synthetase TilS [Desulfatirhabdiaceae bacterium]|nr:tRNA lysidine(34) synthetase TilS [Desulfatirhabdiaceae bacterium]